MVDVENMEGPAEIGREDERKEAVALASLLVVEACAQLDAVVELKLLRPLSVQRPCDNPLWIGETRFRLWD